ncbi:MAG: hypothetical protein AAF621_02495 [Pseudomonadota bacterium]
MVVNFLSRLCFKPDGALRDFQLLNMSIPAFCVAQVGIGTGRSIGGEIAHKQLLPQIYKGASYFSDKNGNAKPFYKGVQDLTLGIMGGITKKPGYYTAGAGALYGMGKLILDAEKILSKTTPFNANNLSSVQFAKSLVNDPVYYAAALTAIRGGTHVASKLAPIFNPEPKPPASLLGKIGHNAKALKNFLFKHPLATIAGTAAVTYAGHHYLKNRHEKKENDIPAI